MNEAIVALVAALGAAFLTGVASLGVVAYQERLRGKAGDADALEACVVALLTRSFGLALRARTLGEMAKARSGVGEGVDVALRQRKPADHLEIYDWLDRDWEPLNTAWSQLWSRGDQELVTCANVLLMTCQEMVSACTDRPPAADAASKIRRAVQGDRWTPEMTERIEAATKALAGARKDLTVLARRKLDRPIIDPFG